MGKALISGTIDLIKDASDNQNTIDDTKIIETIDFKTDKLGIFYDKTIMFTVGLAKMSRAEAKALVEKEGGKILGAVSKKLNYLVVGNSKPTNKKIDKAKHLNVENLDENSWYSLLNRRTSFD